MGWERRGRQPPRGVKSVVLTARQLERGPVQVELVDGRIHVLRRSGVGDEEPVVDEELVNRVSMQPARRRVALDLVVERVRDAGIAPSLRELAEAMGLSGPAGALGHLAALVRQGLLVRHGWARGHVPAPGVAEACAWLAGRHGLRSSLPTPSPAVPVTATTDEVTP